MRLLSILFLVGLIGINVVCATQVEEIHSYMRNDLADGLLGVGPTQERQANFPSSSSRLNGVEEIAKLSTELGLVLQDYIDALGSLTRVSLSSLLFLFFFFSLFFPFFFFSLSFSYLIKQ